MTSPNQENALVCPDCGSDIVLEVWRAEGFHYGIGEDSVELAAVVPIFVCSDCTFEFTDYRAEEARHESVCRHLGVLAPREIIAIRESIGMNRAEFALLGGFGMASLQRWETGALVQNSSNDRLIYLLQFSANRQRLTNRHRPPNEEIAINAESHQSSIVDCRVSTLPIHTISTSALASDETLMRAAGIFTGLMSEGLMFQHV